jgi:predicted nucleic acid-binding protein
MYLLDTNVVIDFFNAKVPQNAKDFLITIEPAISVITRIELFASAKIPIDEKMFLDEFVQNCIIFDHINPKIIEQTITIRQNYRANLPDAIIASTAITYDLTLITRNISDFKNIDNLKVLDPYSF